MWTQSDLHPKNGVSALLQRDIVKEVGVAGVRVLKTDVAWVGQGYSFGLNGVADVAHIMSKYGNDARPFIITVDGWAGTQRYAGVWTGDQTGGESGNYPGKRRQHGADGRTPGRRFRNESNSRFHQPKPHRATRDTCGDRHQRSSGHCHECLLTIPLNGRARPNFRTGPRTQCHGAHGAATIYHGPLQRFVRCHRARCGWPGGTR